MSRPAVFVMVTLTALVPWILPSPALAYMIEIGDIYGCHEHWAQEALDKIGYGAPAPPLDGDDGRLFDAVEFDTSYVDRNIYALSLLLGVRSLDVGEYSALDLSQLVGLQNDPKEQASHCLRSGEDDYEEGDAHGVEMCRDAIRRELDLAFGGDGPPDPGIREDVSVYLLYQGTREVPVSMFYFHVGRALHTIQDSFSHTYRTADRTGVVEVTNWVEHVADDLEPSRDGPPHDQQADACRCDREWGEPTYEAAKRSGEELLELATFAASKAELERGLEGLFDRWLYHVEDCTALNGYCASPDPADIEDGDCHACSCSAAHAEGDGAACGFFFLAAAAASWALRRRE